jgi:ribosomal protein L44E
MTQHFTRSTVSASFYCGYCKKTTQHRIDSGQKGPCLECIDRLNKLHDAAPPKVEEKQKSFWEDAS